MNKKFLILSVVSFLIFIGMKSLLSIAYNSFAVNGVIIITGKVLLVFLGVPFTLGLLTGVVLTKYFSITNSDEEIKVVGGGVLGCSFISSICFSGVCLPVATLGSLFSVLYVIPVLLGIKFSSLINFN